MGLTADFSGAFKKMNTLKTTPRAVRMLGQVWLAKTQEELMRSASQMQKSIEYGGRKSSQLQNNIGQSIVTTGTGWLFGVGTGIGGKQTVKYAMIQDEGGITHPGKDKGMERMKKWAWFMYYKTQPMFRKQFRKTLPNAPGAMVMDAGRAGASRYLGIALTKKPFLTVHVPASHWFTKVIERREPVLYELMSAENIYKTASQMRGGNG